MFRYSLLINDLLKALTHKYIRRVPKGVTKTGATKYVYYYAGQEGHGQGIAHESELIQGASFAFGEHGKSRYHAHITKVDGDKLTIKYDDGDKKGKEETMTKKQFQSLLHGEHKESIKQAQSKAEKQLQEAKTHKERGVKFSDKTMSKLESQVNKLKGIVSPDQPPAEIEASWISEKEKKTFEGQNKVLDLLKDPTLFQQVVQNQQNFSLCTVMLNNIMHAVFKYKDLSSVSSEQKKTILAAQKTVVKNRYSNTDTNALHKSMLIIGDMWQKLPFKQKMESAQVGRVQITDTEISKTSNSTNIDKISNSLKDAKKELHAINPKLDKILYGEVFLSDLSKMLDPKYAGLNMSLQKAIQEQYIHDPDQIYLNVGESAFDFHYTKFFKGDINDLKNISNTFNKQTLIHEFSHRLANELFKKNPIIHQKVKQLYRDAKNNTVHVSKLENVPMEEYLLKSQVLQTVMTHMFNVRKPSASGGMDVLTSDNKNISPSDIDYDNIGKTTYLTSGEYAEQHVIAVPLKNGGVATFKVSKDLYPDGLPSRYAEESVDEFFCETMSAIADPIYGTEPNTFAYKLRKDFTKIINDHIDEF
jgi:hypothetical protein